MADGTDFILEITIPSDDGLRERVEGELYLLDSDGSVVEEGNDGITIAAWFRDAQTRSRAEIRLAELEGGIALHSVDRAKIDWLERYEQSLEPIVVGRKFVVVPDARLLQSDAARIGLVVPQERAFGTGSHPTTAMCIELFEDLAAHASRALDVGTGSGILAIAMKKLGCRRVFAFDNDPETIGVTRDNLRRNGMGVSDVLQFYGGVDAVRGEGFDLVTMNIIPEVILPLLPQIVALLAPGAALILSGILDERAPEVVSAAEASGLRLESQRSSGEWWAGAFRG